MFRAVKSWKRHPKNSNYTVVYRLLHKLFKADEKHMLATAGEARKNLEAAFSYRLLHSDMPVLADQQRLTSTLYGHRIQPRRPARSDGLYG